MASCCNFGAEVTFTYDRLNTEVSFRRLKFRCPLIAFSHRIFPSTLIRKNDLKMLQMSLKSMRTLSLAVPAIVPAI